MEMLNRGCVRDEPRKPSRAHQHSQALTKSEGRRLMAEQKTDKTEVRAMWIMVALVVLIIVAGTGWNMWTHPDWIHGN
jgi:uncharacterized membrane protein